MLRTEILSELVIPEYNVPEREVPDIENLRADQLKWLNTADVPLEFWVRLAHACFRLVRRDPDDSVNTGLVHKLVQKFKSTHILRGENFSDWSGAPNAKKKLDEQYHQQYRIKAPATAVSRQPLKPD
jgi:hypothetical protein